MFINDMLNNLYPEKAVPLDLGADLAYESNYLPSQFNAFEDALQSFTRVGGDVNVGTKKTYHENAPFIGYQDLNRIESCCIKWHDYTPPVTTSITIKPTAQSLNVGNSCTFTVTCKPDKAQDKENYTVTCSDTSKVTVVKSGMNVIATAVGAGDATITVSNNGHSATAMITTQLILVTSITPSETNFTLNKDESKIINLTFAPSNAFNIKDWTVSSNSSSVTVVRISDTQIKVTGVAGGDAALITVTCGSVSATIRATVPVALNKIWLSYKPMNFNFKGNVEAEYPPISETWLKVDWNNPNYYVITDPMSAYSPNYKIGMSRHAVVYAWKTNNYNGSEVDMKPYFKNREETVTVSLNGMSWTVKVKTY